MERNHEPRWCFSQIKGSMDEEMVTDADIISTVEFNQDGRLLATGDKGGRVVIFQREDIRDNESSLGDDTDKKTANHNHSESPVLRPSNPAMPCEYNVYSTFQSHEPEFDYLKSLEIEEKINKIKWLQPRYPSYFLLTTNDKTIKLWKILERDKKFEGFNVKDETGFVVKHSRKIQNLIVPHIKPTELMVEASLKRIYANAHTYHINSISINSDQETYLSADDLRINLWHLDCDNVSFNIVDLKPNNMEDLSEVITAAEFHPTECNIFVYATSKGIVRLCDMRDRALCDIHSKLFEETQPASPSSPSHNSTPSKSFFSEIISSVSDVKFSPSRASEYVDKFATRDYLTVKIWDSRWENKPWHTFDVLDPLRYKLCSLYENDAIFDKFELNWSGNNSILTGSYNNLFRVFDLRTLTEETFSASVPDTQPIKIPTFRHTRKSDPPSATTFRRYKPLKLVRVVASGISSSLSPPSLSNRTHSPLSNHYSSRHDLSRHDSLDYDPLDDTSNIDGSKPIAGQQTESDTDSNSSDEESGKRDSSDIKKTKRCKSSPSGLSSFKERPAPPPMVTMEVDSFDFAKKILHSSYHPRADVIAIGANNNLLVFQKI